jgi:DNA adenine methylase
MRSFRRFDITNEDFASVLNRQPDNAFVYLDPPYYAQGAALYKHAMTDGDHQRLASLVQRCSFQWVLSYDDHPFVRELYQWAEIGSFEMTPTMQTARSARRKTFAGRG